MHKPLKAVYDVEEDASSIQSKGNLVVVVVGVDGSGRMAEITLSQVILESSPR